MFDLTFLFPWPVTSKLNYIFRQRKALYLMLFCSLILALPLYGTPQNCPGFFVPQEDLSQDKLQFLAYSTFQDQQKLLGRRVDLQLTSKRFLSLWMLLQTSDIFKYVKSSGDFGVLEHKLALHKLFHPFQKMKLKGRFKKKKNIFFIFALCWLVIRNSSTI